MTQQIIHQPRLAWDGARVFRAAAGSDEHSAWVTGRIGELLGPDHARAFADCRARLRWRPRADRSQVEAGMWRVRLEDLLRRRPELTEPLQALVADVAARLAEPPR
jgi:hypothetical protein